MPRGMPVQFVVRKPGPVQRSVDEPLFAGPFNAPDPLQSPPVVDGSVIDTVPVNEEASIVPVIEPVAPMLTIAKLPLTVPAV